MNDTLTVNNESSSGAPPSTTLELDYEKYREYLEEFDMSIEQQNELLETLFNIMRTFVEIGFDLDNVQMFNTKKDGISSPDSVNVLTMKDSKELFNEAAKEESHD